MEDPEQSQREGGPAPEPGLAVAFDDLHAGLTGQLAAGETQLGVILNAIPQMVWSTQPDGFHDFYNDRWYEFTGVPRGSTDGAAWNRMFHEADRERAWAKWRNSLVTGEPYEIEYRLRHHSGAYRWVLGRALPARNAAGEIERWFGTCTDIDDRVRAEEETDLIARELSHRIKNIFAVISSLVALSARGDPGAKTFAETVRARIQALALAHEYVRPHSPETRARSTSQSVRGLLEQLLAPYQQERAARFRVIGDDAPIGVRSATSMALVVHEWATNAVKYGALSGDDGHVTIEGRRLGETYELTWRERGGPAVAIPERRGFGSVLSERVVRGQLGATMEQAWDPEGLTVRLATPMSVLTT